MEKINKILLEAIDFYRDSMSFRLFQHIFVLLVLKTSYLKLKKGLVIFSKKNVCRLLKNMGVLAGVLTEK